MTIYKKIDALNDINHTVFVDYGENQDRMQKSILNLLDCKCVNFSDNSPALQCIANDLPDIVFIFAHNRKKDIELCRQMRQAGYMGIAVLIAEDEEKYGGSHIITSEGFDNYILTSDSIPRIKDTIFWAILNRKRRNKYTIQYDDNPDSFYTVDRFGNIYDINRHATDGSGLSPKDVVKNKVNISELGSLEYFRRLIRPLIDEENLGRMFTDTVEDGMSVFQIQTRIHNVPTMGLVATVVKTDITRTIYTRTMDILINSITMLSQRDNYTAAHSSRVFYYCKLLIDKAGKSLNKKFSRDVYLAALLHDIGKIGVRDNVLLKPGKLTKDEFSELASHPVKGFKMLQTYAFLSGTLPLIASHHERPDGKGYPDKLKGNRITLGASIISVADGFDAMTSNRPYRNALSYDKAISEIMDNLGTQFNKDVAEAFLDVITPSLVVDIGENSKKPLSHISQEVIDNILK